MNCRGNGQTSGHLPAKVRHKRCIDGPENIVDPIEINDRIARNDRPIFKVASAIADGRSPVEFRLQRQAMGPAMDLSIYIELIFIHWKLTRALKIRWRPGLFSPTGNASKDLVIEKQVDTV